MFYAKSELRAEISVIKDLRNQTIIKAPNAQKAFYLPRLLTKNHKKSGSSYRVLSSDNRQRKVLQDHFQWSPPYFLPSNGFRSKLKSQKNYFSRSRSAFERNIIPTID
jgi:hypothetical protein